MYGQHWYDSALRSLGRTGLSVMVTSFTARLFGGVTKEERLSANDLCLRCKKHPQATKQFDLWSAPDVLVVHLKRFGSSRALPDKIDVFIYFPVTGLDLGDVVGERRVARDLKAKGVDVEA
ncbi:CSN-associated deubiquitinating enzyme Ubp12 [Pleurotus ostreatus]|uniref:ubiquitinyl hydrolase 1 n=2 Tax=Pleurotus ostreatus TaxID=5322 RepID=A0A8H7DQG0_PLEOS|nr:CSN-associated deubiquitinating enzyme Ubp12 [Pleurotus ostreatus]KAF7423060.1 CSN-associated deubiquitinating enzyme Ubp12 [Pleurotus ostreatus]